MNALFKLAARAALVAVAMSGTAAVAGMQDFVLVNATGYTISEVYVSPVSTADWEEDVMGRDVLGDGENVTIHFSPQDRVCHYDLKVVWDDGDEATWDDFDLCTLSVITLHWDNGRTWADYE